MIEMSAFSELCKQNFLFWKRNRFTRICIFGFDMIDGCKNTANKPLRDKTNKLNCVPSEDSDQGHPPSLIKVFAVWKLEFLPIHWAHSEDSDRTRGRCPAWSKSLLGAHILLVLSWGAQIIDFLILSKAASLCQRVSKVRFGIDDSEFNHFIDKKNSWL